MRKKGIYYLAGAFILLIYGCSDKAEKPALFELLENNTTGINFSNTLTPRADLNMLKYMYFYNGAGVGAGDLE